ncbi:hypothetical protein CBP31_03480 [Oceanisphaera profunda]|uniref:Uncharacterized protein n=1 Tax=Oceanisphaera profunda TaxID=1416627 RepID=A0A1Y0D3K4_9GAMM|nr:capsule biosynthesis GfcC D2 domain-containing protein [Oceanisphaera profunda]ART81797.1 hypothetical protein CBP31_03480 [Oceanisphaera profunda]
MKHLAISIFTLFSTLLLPSLLFNSPLAATAEPITTNRVSIVVRTPTTADALQLQFNQPVRWEQVLGQLQAAGLDARWGQLTKPSEQASLEIQRTLVITDLQVLGQRWARQGKHGLLRSSVELIAQLKTLPLVARQPVNLDIDQVRLQARLNPLLSGAYQLHLPPRSNVVWTQGLVHLAGKRPFVGGGFAYDYGRRLTLLPGAEKQQIWVIQPDGQVMSSPVDPFAPVFVGVAPGATLYVGFASLPAQFANLNQRIMTLFANREI